MRDVFTKINCLLLVLFIVVSSTLPCINAQAEYEATASFVDGYSDTYTSRCNGIYYIYRCHIADPDSDECLRTHLNGHSCTEARCDGSWGEKRDSLGIYQYEASHVCNSPDGGYSSGTRYRTNWQRCAKCGADGNAPEGGASVWIRCGSSPGGYHYIQGRSDGQAYCLYCGQNAGTSTGMIKCTRSVSSTKRISWRTEVQYTDNFDKTNTTQLTGKNAAQIINKYGSDATVRIYNTAASSVSMDNSIVGYQIWEDGTLVQDRGSKDKTNNAYSFSPVTYTAKVTGVKEIQIKLYTTVGAYMLPPIKLISGVHVTVYDTVDSDFDTYDNTSWYSWLDKKQVGDLRNFDDITRTDSGNVGVYKITEEAFGGDNHYSGGGEYDKYYIYGWTTNLTRSNSTGALEPYAGAGSNTDWGHYHAGYQYVSDTKQIINSVDFSQELYRYFKPSEYNIAFNGNHSTSGSMLGMHFVYDRGQILNENTFKRQYEVTLKNTEPWLSDLKSSGGNTNAASKIVDYTFLGWSVHSAIGTTPYFEYDKTTEILKDKQSVGNIIETPDATEQLYAAWETNSLRLPNTITGSDGFVFLDWTDKQYVDNRIHDKTIDNNVDDVDYAVKKNTDYIPYKDSTLYAHWYKDVTLTFNLNGGKANNKANDISLKGTLYDYEDGYTFGIVHNNTTQVKGRYDAQVGSTDAYGTVSENGVNTKYTRQDYDGTIYRFLGWSTDRNAKTPDPNLCVYNPSKVNTYNIKDSTTLYAVWEPVLNISFALTRSLGQLDSSSLYVNSISNITAITSNPNVSAYIRPGEQGNYVITSTNTGLNISAVFDSRMTDIYRHVGTWTDTLNPSTAEDLVTGQGHGLDRSFESDGLYSSRKFYIPQYLGTSNSYSTSIGVKQYIAMFKISQPSFYYKYTNGGDEEIVITGTIYISDRSGSGGGGGGGSDPGDVIVTVLDDLRTKLKIRVK